MPLWNVKFLIPDLLHSKYILQTSYSSLPQLLFFSRRSLFLRIWSQHFSTVVQTLQYCGTNTAVSQSKVIRIWYHDFNISVSQYQLFNTMVSTTAYHGSNSSILWYQLFNTIVSTIQYNGSNSSVS